MVDERHPHPALLRPPPLPQIATAPFPGRVLVIAPHPDDDVIGCGGAMALHTAQGDPVQVLVVTSGLAGDPDGHVPRDSLRAVREHEARAAGAVLGVEDYMFWGYPDGYQVSEADVDQLAQRLGEHVRGLRPDVVYYPWEQETHSDHFAVSIIARRVFTVLPLRLKALGYECWTPCITNWILDITSAMERKAEAIRQHASQTRYTDYVRMARGLNAHRSLYLDSGAGYGEAFVLTEVGGP